jgi:hypothetical protein
MTPRRKKTIKVKERLDDSFLRRRRRIAKKYEGFKNGESAKKAKEAAGTNAPTMTKDAEVAEEPMPLAVIPGPAPHLSREIMEGIAHGFLQIQPAVISATLLDKDDLDE